MYRRLVGPFLLMGVSFTILQTVMIREMLVSFSGNELAIGLILGSWLLLESGGSALAGRLGRRIPPTAPSYAWLQVVLALLLYPSLWAAMRVGTLLSAVPGESIGPGLAFVGALLILAPLGLVDGMMFTTACRVRLKTSPTSLPAGHVYALEAAGSIVGGVGLTYLLLPYLSSTRILLLLAALNLGAAWTLMAPWGTRPGVGRWASGLLSLAALAVLLSPLAPNLHQAALAGRWPALTIAYEGHSNYGHLAVVRSYDQITVLSNGSPVLTAPDPDQERVELLTHLPLLFMATPPRRALVVGGGAGGVLAELQRYPLEWIDYVEADPQLVQALQEVPTPLTTAELNDPRLRLVLQDGRYFVRQQLAQAAPPYDFILLNLPPPTTLVLNRLYTADFMAMLRALLAPEGLLVLPAPPARTYMGPAAADLLACYARTLEDGFASVRAIPADGLTLWLASPQQALELSAETLVQRWQEAGRETHLLQPDYLRYLLAPDAAAAFQAGLSQAGRAEVNRDVRPAGLRYGLAYESALLSPGGEPFFRALGRLRWGHVAGGIGLLTLLGLLLARRRSALLPIAVASTGLLGMAADLLVILSFQVLYGQLYRHVGLLITAFMAGLAAGGLAMTARARRLQRPWRTLAGLELAITLGGAGLTGALALLLTQSAAATRLPHLLLLALNTLVGFLVGLEFPLAQHLLRLSGVESGRAAGFLYAWDLLGATLGAVVVSTVLLPALGVVGTAGLATLLKAGSLLLVGKLSWPSPA